MARKICKSEAIFNWLRRRIDCAIDGWGVDGYAISSRNGGNVGPQKDT
ncbi:MAG: hypothetical protein ACYCSP_09560 [Acidobacteriaceae bacterium]